MQNEEKKLDETLDATQATEETAVAEKGVQRTKNKLWYIIGTVACSAILLVIYRVSLGFDFFPIVMWTYMAVLTALILFYIFYNRGFSRMGVTEDMLPVEWSADEKQKYINGAKKRMKSSRIVLVFIIGFLVTFLYDSIELFVFPMISVWF